MWGCWGSLVALARVLRHSVPLLQQNTSPHYLPGKNPELMYCGAASRASPSSEPLPTYPLENRRQHENVAFRSSVLGSK